jgi:hypothetical protein
VPERNVCDRDELFALNFWRGLHACLGINIQMSTLFHPVTDRRSERTNKAAAASRRSTSKGLGEQHLPVVTFAKERRLEHLYRQNAI